MNRSGPARVIVDSWYGPPLVERLGDVGGMTANSLLHRLPASLRRSGASRAIALVVATGRADVLVTTNPSPGTRTLIALTGLLGRRNLVLLEYIAHPPGAGGGWRGTARRLAFGLLRRVLLPRALRTAQVLTAPEVESCARSHGIAADRFRYVRWPARLDGDSALPDRVEGGRRVLCSGRRTDWATFAAAAADSDWEVTAVCGAGDAAEVRSLLDSDSARVLVEVSQAEHADLVRAATVYVVAMSETGASIGQVRVMNAADAGTPLVVSSVLGVADYVDGTCAVLVPPGDPAALRAAVDELLADPARQAALRQALHERGSGQDMAHYLDQLADLIRPRR